MWNRIDHNITQADKATIQANLNQIKSVLSFLIAQTPKDRKRAGWTASSKGHELAKRALAHGKQNAQLLSPQINLIALEKDTTLVTDLNTIESMLENLLQNVRDTRLWVQNEASQQGMLIYKLLQIANKNGFGAEEAINDMKPYMPRTGRKKK